MSSAPARADFTPSARRRRGFAAGWPMCSRSATTRCSPRTSTTRRRLPSRRLRSRARRADAAGAGASGLLRLGDHGRGRRLADGRHRRAVARRRQATPTAPSPAVSSRSTAVPSGEKIAYVRMFSGTIRTRDRVELGHDERKVTAIRRVRTRCGASTAERSTSPARSASSGASATSGSATPSARRRSRPTTRISSRRRRWRRSSLPAIPTIEPRFASPSDQLAEQDPLINVRQDDARQEISVSLYGEVQKEVIQATLADDFGLDVRFHETTTICIERPVGIGRGPRNPSMTKRTRTPPRSGLRIEPARSGSGVAVPPRRRPSHRCRLHIYKTADGFVDAHDGSTSDARSERACSAGR